MTSLLAYLAGLVGLVAPRGSAPPPPAAPRVEPRLVISDAARGRFARPMTPRYDRARIFAPATPPPGVVPEDAEPSALAMDWDPGWAAGAGWGQTPAGVLSENLYWLGWPYLAELSQRAEYRMITEATAREMTRKWIKIKAKSEDDKSERIKELEDRLRDLGVQQKFRRLAELDGFFGRGHLFIDARPRGVAELSRSEMLAPLSVDPRKLARGMLRGLKVIEPAWTYPGYYNSINPLADDWYVPRTWYVMGKEVHRSRLPTFVGREMPDLLKPAYSFGGVSLSQLCKPYVDNWLRTRQSVSDMVHSFSIVVLASQLGSLLNGGAGDDEAKRMVLFSQMRDNLGTMVIDKEREALTNVSAPLGSLDHLQAQAQEHLASVSHTPLVVLTGISPSGLNATSEEEMHVWNDWITASQEHLFRPGLDLVFRLAQLDLWGEIDPDLMYEFEKLQEESAKDAADRKKTEADTVAVYSGLGAVGPQEIRDRIAQDPDLPFENLDLSEPAPGEVDRENELAGMVPGGGGEPEGGGGTPGEQGLRQGEQGLLRKAVSGGDVALDQDLSPVRRVRVGGLTIGVEYNRGDARYDVNQMPCDYGYLMRTRGRDGDRIDVLLGPLAPERGPVFLVDQVDERGAFDEHKLLLGFETQTEARAAYDRVYADTPMEAGRVRQFDWAGLRGWLRSERDLSTKAEAGYVARATDPAERCGACEHWLGGGACGLVVGAISAAGWCELFEDGVEGTGSGGSVVGDAEFEEEEHPRDKGGKFAKTAAGAKAGHEYHKARAKAYLGVKNENVAAPHRRAAQHYLAAYGHYSVGSEGTAHLSHAAAEKEALSAYKRAQNAVKAGKLMPPVVEKPAPPAEKPVPAPSTLQAAEPAGMSLSGLALLPLSFEQKSPLSSMLANWDKVTSANKAKIEPKLAELEHIAKLHEEGSPTSPLVKGWVDQAVDKLEPIVGSGQAVGTVNAIITALKQQTEKPPAQAKTEQTPGSPPHHRTEATHYLEDASGKEVRATLRIDTKQIADAGYEKVTQALTKAGGDAEAGSVCIAMGDYRDVMWDKFSPQQQNALKAYKDGEYRPINKALLQGSVDKGSYGLKIARLRAVMKMSAVPADMPVRRGLSVSLQHLTGFDDASRAVGRCFVHKNFASMSRKKDTADNFGKRVTMHMTIKAGTPGVVVGSQDQGSEAEILLPDHGVFRIERVAQKPGGGHDVHVTYMGSMHQEDQ